MSSPKINQVIPLNNYQLSLTFESGEKKIFDVTPYIKNFFEELRNESYFKRVKNLGHSVIWPHEQDFSAGTLYHLGK